MDIKNDEYQRHLTLAIERLKTYSGPDRPELVNILKNQIQKMSNQYTNLGFKRLYNSLSPFSEIDRNQLLMGPFRDPKGFGYYYSPEFLENLMRS